MKSTACTCAAPASASARVKRPMPAPSSSTRRPASDGGSSPAQPDQRSQRTAAPGSGQRSAGYRGCAGRIDSRRTRAGYRGCAGRAATDRGAAQRTHDLRPLGCVELPRFRVQHHGLQRRLGGVLRPVRFLGARDSAARQPPSVAQGSPRRTSRPRPRARAPTDSVTSERASKCAAVQHARRRARSPGRRMQCRCAAAREAAASRTMAARSSSGGCWAPLSASVAALACEAAAEAAGSAAAASIPVLARAQTERRRPAQAREGRVGCARLAVSRTGSRPRGAHFGAPRAETTRGEACSTAKRPVRVSLIIKCAMRPAGVAPHRPAAPNAASKSPPLTSPPTAAQPATPATHSPREPVRGPGGSAAHADASAKRSMRARSRSGTGCSASTQGAGVGAGFGGTAAVTASDDRALVKASRRAAMTASACRCRTSIACKAPSSAVCLASLAAAEPCCGATAMAGMPERMRSPCSVTAERMDASARLRLEGSTTSCVPRKSTVLTASWPHVPYVATLRDASAYTCAAQRSSVSSMFAALTQPRRSAVQRATRLLLLVPLAQRVHKAHEACIHVLFGVTQRPPRSSLLRLHRVLRLQQLREARHVASGPGRLALRGRAQQRPSALHALQKSQAAQTAGSSRAAPPQATDL